MKRILWIFLSLILLTSCETMEDPNGWTVDDTYNDEVYAWIVYNQLSNGLQKSTDNGTMISTYDNALAALVYTMKGDYELAEAVFDFFSERIDTELNDEYGGFAQFHDLQGNIVGGSIGKRWLGDNAWLLVAINQYHYETNTTTYQTLQEGLDTWIRSLQQEDGSLSSGYQEDGTMMAPVTEAMIDSYNAVLGYDEFHINLLSFLDESRFDETNGVLMAWPDNPNYRYSLDMSSWAFLGMNDVPTSVLTFADYHFLFEEDGIQGYCHDEDLDAILMEHSMQMALAYVIAGDEYFAQAKRIIENIEQFMMVSPSHSNTMGLPYASRQGTMYGAGDLWNGVDTDIYLSGSAWYLFTKYEFNPFEAGLLNKEELAPDDMFYN